MAEIRLTAISKTFGDVAAVAEIDLTVGDGEFVVLLGPTGAGKTTILRLIAGLEKPDRGTIAIGGRDAANLSPAERDVAFVFQQYSLYPHLSVFDNLAFPLRAPQRRHDEASIRASVERIAKLLRIEGKLGNRATRLSGGEMQRVAIGRALVRSPAIYLMDEPLSSLDAKLRADMRLELQHIQRDLGATMLYVTHDQIEAMTMATRIGVLDRGRLMQVGTPREIYESPRNLYVATRLGTPAINLLPIAAFPDQPTPPGTVTIGARTEHIRVERSQAGQSQAGQSQTGQFQAGLAAKVEWIEHLGDQNHLHLVLGPHRLVTLVDAEMKLAVGDAVAIRLENALFFAADGERIDP